MASMSNAAKYDALNAIIPAGSTIKVAFYTGASAVDATTPAYTATGEVTQPGATPAINAGGLALSGRTITASDGSVATAGTDFSDVGPVTPNASFTFRKILVHDSTRTRALLFHDYGTDQVWNAGTAYMFTIPGTGSFLLQIA
jgi:hypothetical protein